MAVKLGTWALAPQCEQRAEARSKHQGNKSVGEGNGAVGKLVRASNEPQKKPSEEPPLKGCHLRKC